MSGAWRREAAPIELTNELCSKLMTLIRGFSFGVVYKTCSEGEENRVVGMKKCIIYSDFLASIGAGDKTLLLWLWPSRRVKGQVAVVDLSQGVFVLMN